MSPVLDLNQTHLYQAFSVLLVDDEVGMQLVLKKALSKWFSRVDLASSIEEAEVLRGEHHYDLLILDINLPGRSGIEWEEAFTDPDHRPDSRILRPPSALSNWGQAILSSSHLTSNKCCKRCNAV